jgi:hypothetical protein
MVAGMALAVPNGIKVETAAAATADSPKSVLEDEVIVSHALCILLAEVFQRFGFVDLTRLSGVCCFFFVAKLENF